MHNLAFRDMELASSLVALAGLVCRAIGLWVFWGYVVAALHMGMFLKALVSCMTFCVVLDLVC